MTAAAFDPQAFRLAVDRFQVVVAAKSFIGAVIFMKDSPRSSRFDFRKAAPPGSSAGDAHSQDESTTDCEPDND